MTETSRAFANSQKVNPLDFLQNGETAALAKMRLLDTAKAIIFRGLTTRDGKLCFGLNIDDARVDYQAMTDSDVNYMRHANDSLLNNVGALLTTWSNALMPPEKAWAEKANHDNVLPQLQTLLDRIQKYPQGQHVQPQRWDNCGHHIGGRSSGVSAQASLAGKGTTLTK